MARRGDRVAAESLLAASVRNPAMTGSQTSRLARLQMEAGVRVLLRQPEIALRQLVEYLEADPIDREVLLRSRRFEALRSDPRFPAGRSGT